MPLITTDAPSRAVEMNIEVPGTPEQVWQAFATGRGMAAWFVPTELEERVGGDVVFHLGPGMDSAGKVTRWEPPQHFSYVEPAWSEGAPPIETDVDVQPLTTGKGCAVRMVHRLNTADAQWDGALRSMEIGWGGYFPVLRIYLERFPGAESSSFRTMVPQAKPQSAAWAALAAAWNLGEAEVGDGVKLALAPGLEVTGTLERLHTGTAGHCDAMVQLEQPTTGVAQIFAGEWEGQVLAGLTVIYYGENAAAARSRDEQPWLDWFASTAPAASAPDA